MRWFVKYRVHSWNLGGVHVTEFKIGPLIECMAEAAVIDVKGWLGVDPESVVAYRA